MFFFNINKFEELRAEIEAKDKIILTAETFSLTRLDGEEVSVNLHKRDTLLLNFWATWCKPCIEEMLVDDQTSKSKYYISLESLETIKGFMRKHPNINVDTYRLDSIELPFEPKKIPFYPYHLKIYDGKIVK
ncbi:hypothetical protein BST97_07480 [Nonlabens spongiae]|uniref:Alkyl hydroperoxide reductase subunit C/ Thiol specific antioxidant domain-containing protein n=2 Tax=Nonlabens spongiae TaxID=331648 RepID=A0A1W6MJS0_9FLAO|nr:hypothetical protein BST97_07480 [Nonlabens spongiae]